MKTRRMMGMYISNDITMIRNCLMKRRSKYSKKNCMNGIYHSNKDATSSCEPAASFFSSGNSEFNRPCADFGLHRHIFIDPVIEHDAVKVIEFVLEHNCQVSFCLDFNRLALCVERLDLNTLIAVYQTGDILIHTQASFAARKIGFCHGMAFHFWV